MDLTGISLGFLLWASGVDNIFVGVLFWREEYVSLTFLVPVCRSERVF